MGATKVSVGSFSSSFSWAVRYPKKERSVVVFRWRVDAMLFLSSAT